MTVAIITARGGSTRIPRKNLAMLCGKPLVVWSIEQALACALVDETWLTTDDDEIAEVGRRAGAMVIRRPVWDNGVSAGVPFLHALDELRSIGKVPDHVLALLPTSPLRRPGNLERLVLEARAQKCVVTTACPQKETYIHRLPSPWKDRSGRIPGGLRSFDGQLVVKDKFWNYARLCGGETAGPEALMRAAWASAQRMDIDNDTAPIEHKTERFVPLESWQAFDIDYPEDLALVGILMREYVIGASEGELA